MINIVNLNVAGLNNIIKKGELEKIWKQKILMLSSRNPFKGQKKKWRLP